jgi:hypothetical protein
VNSGSQTSLNKLILFLNSHSNDSFTREDVQLLFEFPNLAEALNRVIHATMNGTDCVLGIDELKVSVMPNFDVDRRYESLEDGEWEKRGWVRSEDDVRYFWFNSRI